MWMFNRRAYVQMHSCSIPSAHLLHVKQRWHVAVFAALFLVFLWNKSQNSLAYWIPGVFLWYSRTWGPQNNFYLSRNATFFKTHARNKYPGNWWKYWKIFVMFFGCFLLFLKLARLIRAQFLEFSGFSILHLLFSWYSGTWDPQNNFCRSSSGIFQICRNLVAGVASQFMMVCEVTFLVFLQGSAGGFQTHDDYTARFSLMWKYFQGGWPAYPLSNILAGISWKISLILPDFILGQASTI